MTLLLYAALGGALYFLPFDLIQVHHYSPVAAGAALMPLIVLISVLSGWAGRLVDRYGFKKVHRCAVLAAESRAGQYKYSDIENAAAHLHGMLEALRPARR